MSTNPHNVSNTKVVTSKYIKCAHAQLSCSHTNVHKPQTYVLKIATLSVKLNIKH